MKHKFFYTAKLALNGIDSSIFGLLEDLCEGALYSKDFDAYQECVDAAHSFLTHISKHGLDDGEVTWDANPDHLFDERQHNIISHLHTGDWAKTDLLRLYVIPKKLITNGKNGIDIPVVAIATISSKAAEAPKHLH